MKNIHRMLMVGLLAIFIVVYGVGMQWDIRGKAAQEVTIREGLLPTISLRLLRPPQAGKPIDIGVSVNTAGIETAQADLVVLYDPAMLRIEENDVERLSEYRTMNFEQPEPGRLMINLFTSDSTSDRFVSSAEDIQVAILHFQPVSHEIHTTIDLVFDRTKENTSGLYPPHSQTSGVMNILSSARGVTVSTK